MNPLVPNLPPHREQTIDGTPRPAPGKAAITLRALGATLLAGTISPLLFGFMVTGYIALNSLERESFDLPNALLIIGMTGVFGSVLAIPCAFIQAVVVEVPLAIWHTKRRVLTVGRHITFSCAAAILVVAAVFEIIQPSENWDNFVTGLGFTLLAALCGGVCSAWFWSKLVLRRL